MERLHHVVTIRTDPSPSLDRLPNPHFLTALPEAPGDTFRLAAGHQIEMTRSRVVLVGVVLFVLLVGGAVADYSTIQADIDDAEVTANEITALFSLSEEARQLCGTNVTCREAISSSVAALRRYLKGDDAVLHGRAARSRRKWERHRIWFAFGAGGIVLITAAAAYALPRRRETSL